jgi:hypothetical protein
MPSLAIAIDLKTEGRVAALVRVVYRDETGQYKGEITQAQFAKLLIERGVLKPVEEATDGHD